MLRTLALLTVFVIGMGGVEAAKAEPPEGKGKETSLKDLSCFTDQIAKFDGIDWVCAEDNSGLVVRDDADNLLGSVITVFGNTTTVLFDQDPLVAPWFDANPIATLVLKPDGVQSTNPAGSVIVRWTALGCFGERGDVY